VTNPPAEKATAGQRLIEAAQEAATIAAARALTPMKGDGR